jgi:hypothetical protein
VDEIQGLVNFFAKRQDAEVRADKKATVAGGGRFSPAQTENYILLGDFNVVSPKHETAQALRSKGFQIPEAIDGDKVRHLGDHFYDQIAVRVKDPRFAVTAGGMFDVFEHVYRDEDIALYDTDTKRVRRGARAGGGGDKPGDDDDLKFYRRWRTWQISDHSPLWVKITTDFADDYLQKLIR